MIKFFTLTAFAVALVPCLQAQDITGDWQGTLSAGGMELRLALHINKSADGSYQGTMDSIDQNANGIPLSAISVKDSNVSFNVDAVHGSYEGKLAAGAITGTWTQGQPLPLTFKRGVSAKASAPAPPSDIDGAWLGTLDVGSAKLRIVFHITNTANGLTATMDSPDQGANGIPVTIVTRKDSSLKLELKQMGGVFDGSIDKDLQGIQGTWSQAGNSFPLVLKRTKSSADLKPVEHKRPQNPVKPYPYREEEVTYKNAVAGFDLAATFTIPEGKGPFPSVVLITGSGPQDRDEALMGHRPFLVLADYLTRHGIAVLRADDRGTAKSGGKFEGATTSDFATDTEAGLTYLKTRPEADPHRLGLIGHSEGGAIAPMIAARNHDVAFIVMLAGPGVPGDQVLLEQERLIFLATGMKADEVETKEALNRQVFALIKSDHDEASLDKRLHDVMASEFPPTQIDHAVKVVTAPWFRFFLTYDPATALRKVTCPVLALNGEKDLQVPPKQNLPAVKQALTEAGNQNFETIEMPGLNHLFQTAKTGSPSEYEEIEETMSPAVLQKVASWINGLGQLANK